MNSIEEAFLLAFITPSDRELLSMLESSGPSVRDVDTILSYTPSSSVPSMKVLDNMTLKELYTDIVHNEAIDNSRIVKCVQIPIEVTSDIEELM